MDKTDFLIDYPFMGEGEIGQQYCATRKLRQKMTTLQVRKVAVVGAGLGGYSSLFIRVLKVFASLMPNQINGRKTFAGRRATSDHIRTSSETRRPLVVQ